MAIGNPSIHPFVCLANRRFHLTVLNPTFVTGPVLSSVEHGSAIVWQNVHFDIFFCIFVKQIVCRMLSILTFPAAPKACVGVVDVRDVARAHLIALPEREETNGQRILVTHGRPVWFADMLRWLRGHFQRKGD